MRGKDGRYLSGAWQVTMASPLPSAPPTVGPADLDRFRALIVRDMRDALEDARHRANDNTVTAAHDTLCEVLRYLGSAATTASIATHRERVISLRDRLGPVWQDQLKDLDARLWPAPGREAFRHGNDLQAHVDGTGLLRTLRILTAALLFEVILSDQDKPAMCDVARQTHAAYCGAIIQRLVLPWKLLHGRIDRDASDSLDQVGPNGHWHLAQQQRFEEERRALDDAARRIERVIRRHAPLFDPDLLVRRTEVNAGAWCTVLSLEPSANSPLCLTYDGTRRT